MSEKWTPTENISQVSPNWKGFMLGVVDNPLSEI
jgi:hypothetical protein